MNLLKTFWHTAVTEWKLLVRQRTLWLLAGLFFLVGWISLDHDSLPLASAIGIATNIAQGLGPFGSLFVAIFGAMNFLREYKPAYSTLWVRPFSTSAYWLGKILGVCAGFATALVPITLWVAYLEASLHGPAAILVLLRIWAILLVPTFLTVLAITWLLSMVLHKPLWTALVMVGLIGALQTLTLDLTYLVAFVPQGIYDSPLIGFGPDCRLLRLHQLFYLELPLLVLWLGLPLARRTAPRREQKWDPVRAVAWGSVAVGMLAVMVHTGTNFQTESDRRVVDPPANILTEAAADCNRIQTYQAEVTLRQETARLEGRMQLHLQLGDDPVSLPLQLNDGLELLEVTVTPSVVSAQVVEDALVLEALQALQNEDVWLTLTYAGEILAPRYAYDHLFRSMEVTVAPFQAGGYLDQESVFLAEDGNWRPFSSCPLDELTVTWPDAPVDVVHTADQETISPEGLTLQWEDPPRPLLAASMNYGTVQIGEVTLLTAPNSIPADQLETVYSPYAAMLSLMTTLLQEEVFSGAPEGRLVATPLLKYDRYDPQAGVYWIAGEENTRLLLRDSAESLQGEIYNPGRLYSRWTAETMLRTWWCQEQACPLFQARGKFNQNYSMIDLTAQGPLSFTGQVQLEDQPVLNALASYSALRLSEPVVGEAFVAEEMAARQRVMEDYMFYLQLDLPFAHSPQVNELMIRLDGLWEAAGPEAFWNLVREYQRSYGVTSLSTADFETIVEQETGTPLP